VRHITSTTLADGADLDETYTTFYRTMGTILLVDHDIQLVTSLSCLLKEEGHEVLHAEQGAKALSIMQEQDLDLIIIEMQMPDMDGLALLAAVKTLNRDLPVIMVTAFGEVEKAVAAMRTGAYTYLTKPFNNEELVVNARKAVEHYSLVRENRRLRDEVKARYGFANMVGKNPRMRQIYQLIEKVAPTPASVLITGESGTGKELVARAIHFNSPREKAPFISVNCAALPETLLESELFGHEKGAFTGAASLRKGRFELADTGTLFLDEIGDIPLTLQAKLLRVLQERSFERVGGSRSLSVDVRIITATNREVRDEVEKGRFREDLYYRLNVVHIHLPPLRERIDDIPLLTAHFIAKFATLLNRPSLEISAEALRFLMTLPWEGNIRELENTIERAAILCSGNRIEPEDVQPDSTPLTHGTACFTEVFLPASEKPDEQTSTAKKIKIYLFDDDKNQLEMMKLHINGYIASSPALSRITDDIIALDDVNSTVNAIKKDFMEFDNTIMISDIFMPGIYDGGIKLYGTIKEMKQNNSNINPVNIKLILTSNRDEAKEETRSINKEQYNLTPRPRWAYPIQKPDDTPSPSGNMLKLLQGKVWTRQIVAAIKNINKDIWMNDWLDTPLNELSGISISFANILKGIQDNKGEKIVVVVGENGTGRDAVATALHRAEDVGKFKHHLVDNESHGYLSGRLYGSQLYANNQTESSEGLLEESDNGTVFLDNWGYLKGEERRIENDLKTYRDHAYQPLAYGRIGNKDFDKKENNFSGRIIIGIDSATHNEDDIRGFLEKIGNPPRIDIPPLRERKDDIQQLAIRLLSLECTKQNRHLKCDHLPTEFLDSLLQYSWPRNDRELENTINHVVNSATSVDITVDLLPESIRNYSPPPKNVASSPPVSVSATGKSPEPVVTPQETRSHYSEIPTAEQYVDLLIRWNGNIADMAVDWWQGPGLQRGTLAKRFDKDFEERLLTPAVIENLIATGRIESAEQLAQLRKRSRGRPRAAQKR